VRRATDKRSAAGRRRAAFTLVEVLLTALILSVGLTVLLSSLSTCLRTMKLARQYEQVEWALGLGELAYPDPLTPSTDVVKDYTVPPDDALAEGFTFERTVDGKTDEEKKTDRLYTVHVRVSWGEGGAEERPREELVRYVWERGT
jgi:hypothetical protein